MEQTGRRAGSGLSFSSIFGLLLRLSVAPVLASACNFGEAPVERPARPNVLIVTIDTLRADHLGAFGSTDDLTPRLDAFARTGRAFLETVAPMGTTFPSHSSMFTGLYPGRHGVRSNADALADSQSTLAETLEADGYATAAFVSFKSMVHRGGLGQGFQRRSRAKKNPRDSPIRPGRDTVRAALRWLEKAQEPFLLWVHLFEPHLPLPLTTYAAERMGAYRGPLADGATVREVMSLRGTWKDSAEATAALQALYAGRVIDADALFGRLLDGLADRKSLDDTLVIATSDHGELLGEFGEIGHGTQYEPAIRVPLLIGGPGVEPGVVRSRAGLVDLTPTILEWLGFEPPGNVDGRSLAGALRGEPLTSATYFAEVRVPSDPGAGTDPLANRLNGAVAWRDNRKVVVTEDEARLFDLETDPREVSPLAPGRTEELVAAARAHAEGPLPRADALDDKTARELRALGYIE